MKSKKNFPTANLALASAGILSAITFPIFALSSAINLVAFDIKNYEYNVLANGLSELTKLNMPTIMGIYRDLLLFLKTNDYELLTRHFDERSSMHMLDVYKLFSLNKSLLLISSFLLIIFVLILIGLLIFKFGKRPQNISELDGQIRKSWFFVFRANLFVFCLLISCFLGLLFFDFSELFLRFHLLFFNNDLWLLDADSLMIKLLPEEFFAFLAFKILKYAVTILGLCYAFFYIIFKLLRR